MPAAERGGYHWPLGRPKANAPPWGAATRDSGGARGATLSGFEFEQVHHHPGRGQVEVNQVEQVFA